MDLVNKLECILNKEISNLKKNPNRIYTNQHIQKKKQQIIEISCELDKIIVVEDFLKIKLLLKDFIELVRTRQVRVELHLQPIPQPLIDLNISEFFEMAEGDPFNLKLFNSLIPEFDGNKNSVNDFLSALQQYNSTLNTNGQTLLLQSVLAYKLKKSASLKIALQPRPTTFQAFHDLILRLFGPKLNLLQLNTKLAKTVQLTTVSAFVQSLEALNTEFLLYHRAHGTQGAVDTLVESQVLNQFVSGLKPELQTAVLAANPTDLVTASNLALNAESVVHAQKQINFIRTKIQNNRNNPNNNNNNRNNSNNSFTRNNTNSNCNDVTVQ